MAQDNVLNKAVTYEDIYDDPYDINKLFVHIIPIYGEFFRTNINAGFGVKADYYLGKKADFSFFFRKPYSKKADFVRYDAIQNSDFENTPKTYYLLELGGAYHIIDKEKDGKSKFILYSKSLQKPDQWESTIHEHVEAPVKVRQIYAARLGGFYYQSALDIKDILKAQHASLYDSAGDAMPSELKAFGNLSVGGIYLGGALTQIRNVALKFDKTYDQVSSDLIFSAYLDLMYAPLVAIKDLYYRPSPGSPEVIYYTSNVKTNPLGFRIGIDGKFNRDLGWGYGIESGIRPGIKKQGVYFLGRISFPLVSSKLTSSVEAFGK